MTDDGRFTLEDLEDFSQNASMYAGAADDMVGALGNMLRSPVFDDGSAPALFDPVAAGDMLSAAYANATAIEAHEAAGAVAERAWIRLYGEQVVGS